GSAPCRAPGAAAAPGGIAGRVAATPVLSLPAQGPVRLRFPAASAALGPETEALLALLAKGLAADGGSVDVVAEGAPPALALDRARAVAVRLVQEGVSGERLRLKTGGAGDGVTVYRPGAGA
ncbi:MAG: hypothetical protein KDG89_15950, partial [Geminicoccaceae bacterium]|nr:hypothetical protein [Geminicoccaceae bacterium]